MTGLPTRVSIRRFTIELSEDTSVLDRVLATLTHIISVRREDPKARHSDEVLAKLDFSVVIDGEETACRAAPLRLFEQDLLALTATWDGIAHMFLVTRRTTSGQPATWEVTGEYLLRDDCSNLYEIRQKTPWRLIYLIFG